MYFTVYTVLYYKNLAIGGLLDIKKYNNDLFEQVEEVDDDDEKGEQDHQPHLHLFLGIDYKLIQKRTSYGMRDSRTTSHTSISS